MVKKKGEEYKCEECGLVVVVDNPCECEACELVCCEQPMKPVKATAKRTASKTLAKAKKAPEKPKK